MACLREGLDCTPRPSSATLDKVIQIAEAAAGEKRESCGAAVPRAMDSQYGAPAGSQGTSVGAVTDEVLDWYPSSDEDETIFHDDHKDEEVISRNLQPASWLMMLIALGMALLWPLAWLMGRGTLRASVREGKAEDDADDDADDGTIDLCAVGDEPATPTKPPVAGARLIWVTADSGAGKSCTGRKLIGDYAITPSAGSKRGQKFVGPGGEVYPNLGEAALGMAHETSGKACNGTFQVAEGLNKTLMAISDANDRGNLAIFGAEASGLIPQDGPEGREIRRLVQKALRRNAGLEMQRRNGVFGMPMWVLPPGKPGFAGPAKHP